MTMASKGLDTHGGPGDCISQCHWCNTIMYVHSVVTSQLNALLMACPHYVTKSTFKSPIVWKQNYLQRFYLEKLLESYDSRTALLAWKGQ